MTAKNIIVYSCDSVFFPLLKGSILSLDSFDARKKLDLDIGFIDIGCKPEETEWLKDNNVTVVDFTTIEDVLTLSHKLEQYNRSQICRPYLPDIFTNYQNIIWCDSDIWFQTLDGIKLYVETINEHPDSVVCCPFVDTSYAMNYRGLEQQNLSKFLEYYSYWYSKCYNPQVAELLKGRALFSSGLFAMNRKDEKWNLWKQDLNVVYKEEVLNNVNLRHLAEQTAFNKIIYQTGKFIPVESSYNYNCHVGILELRNKKLCVAYPPYKIIDTVHLTATGKFIKHYIDNGWLWNQGSYLTEEEKQTLMGICHY